MSARRNAGNCRWAVPTLFMPAPWWFDAEARPWTCARQDIPRPLSTTDPCTDCPYWEPHPRQLEHAGTVTPTVVDYFDGMLPHEAS